VYEGGATKRWLKVKQKGWRATFYTTSMEHSPTSATGTGVRAHAVARGPSGGMGGVEKDYGRRRLHITPETPARPEPNRSREAGSGTGLGEAAKGVSEYRPSNITLSPKASPLKVH